VFEGLFILIHASQETKNRDIMNQLRRYALLPTNTPLSSIRLTTGKIQKLMVWNEPTYVLTHFYKHVRLEVLNAKPKDV
jgi:hypothetical protein